MYIFAENLPVACKYPNLPTFLDLVQRLQIFKNVKCIDILHLWHYKNIVSVKVKSCGALVYSKLHSSPRQCLNFCKSSKGDISAIKNPFSLDYCTGKNP